MKTVLYFVAFALISLFVIAVFLILVLTVIMIIGSMDKLKNPEDIPIVVPGCKIKEDKPRETLKLRLDAAFEYLAAHPKSVCVVCGGYYGSFTEAEVMKKYLENKGISPKRILCDDKSKTTYENIKYARELLPKAADIYIATNRYHLYRAKLFAKSFNFIPHSLVVKTPLLQIFYAWPREYSAVIKAWIKGR